MRKFNPRHCTIFNCDHRHGNICCADCGYNPAYNGNCKNPCLNGPERCKCATDRLSETPKPATPGK